MSSEAAVWFITATAVCWLLLMAAASWELVQGERRQKQHANPDQGNEQSMTTIIVNGREVEVEGNQVTFERIAAIADCPVDTITWRLRGRDGGMLRPGQAVYIDEGMIFSAAATGSA